MKDLETLAVGQILMIDSVLTSKTDKNQGDLKKKLRSRARELPSLVLDAGLTTALLFYASKASSDYDKVSTWIKCREERLDTKVDLGSSDSYAYAVILRLTACALTHTGMINQQVDNMADLVKTLKTLREKGGEYKATRLLQPYLISLKRASEALWETE